MRTMRRLLAVIFGSAATMKLSGSEMMRRKFEEWGYSDELRLMVGTAEAAAATLLWTGRGRPAAKGIASVVMLGAAATHLKTPGERMQAVAPLAVLAATYLALDL